ncbi:MAG: hypothetical protein ACJA1B_001422 [Polaribacter sp.]|jgi:hypothetical protein
MDIFNTIAAATKPQKQNYKPKFYYLRRCVKIINKSKNTTDLHEARNLVNKVFLIHQEVTKLINLMELNKEWYLLQEGPDYYFLQDSIESAYFLVKDKYHDLHWNQKGFNAY